MEINSLFMSVGVVLVGILAIFSMLGFYNNSYGTDLGTTFNDTLVATQEITETTLEDISLDVADNTIPDSGSAPATEEGGLLSRGWATFTKIGDLMGLIPSMFGYAATAIGVPDAYVNIAKWVFLAIFGVTIGYIFLLGVKKFTGL